MEKKTLKQKIKDRKEGIKMGATLAGIAFATGVALVLLVELTKAFMASTDAWDNPLIEEFKALPFNKRMEILDSIKSE